MVHFGSKYLLACAVALATGTPALAANLVFTNMGDPVGSTSNTTYYANYNWDHPIFGTDLTLSQPGTLQELDLTFVNAYGYIVRGDIYLTFYDNTTPYLGGTLSNPVLTTVDVVLDYANTPDGALGPGLYLMPLDLTSQNIHLPQNILITQQFSLTEGDCIGNGVVVFGPPTVGSGTGLTYFKSDSTAEGYYPGGAPGYYLTVTPDFSGEPQAVPLPAAATGFAVLTAALGLLRIRRKLARA